MSKTMRIVLEVIKAIVSALLGGAGAMMLFS